MPDTDLTTRYINPATYPPPIIRPTTSPTSGIKVGDPVSIRYFTDRRAGVVTRVTPKTVTVARVETGPGRPDMACDVGAYGARPEVSDGILDQIIEGTEQRFHYNKINGRWTNSGSTLRLGISQTWIDYRF